MVATGRPGMCQWPPGCLFGVKAAGSCREEPGTTRPGIARELIATSQQSQQHPGTPHPHTIPSALPRLRLCPDARCERGTPGRPPLLSPPGYSGHQHLQLRAAAKNRALQQGSPVRGKLWAAGRACGAILRGVRDYSWPVNIDSGGSGAAAQPGNAIFRARQEERPGAELGALSPGGRGQGEDVSSVIAARGSQQQHGAGWWEHGTPQQGAGCAHSPLSDTSVPYTSRSSVGGPAQPMLEGIGCALHSGPRVSQTKGHRGLHKGLKKRRESYKCKIHGWVYFCGCHSTGTPLGTLHQPVLP